MRYSAIFRIQGKPRTVRTALRAAVRVIGTVLAAMLAVAPVNAAPQTAAASTRLSARDGAFFFSGWAGPAFKVFFHLPPKITAATPVVFVLHGAGRDADHCMKIWAPFADANHFIVVAPDFDAASFPGSNPYAFGGVLDKDGKLQPRAKWTLSAIEPLFDEVKLRTGSAVRAYAIFGHSAGAHFVQRLIMLEPGLRIRAAVAANAGSYAMPDFSAEYPFGLKNTPVNAAQLRQAFAMPLVILLGTADTGSAYLPQEPGAVAEGPNRFARGKNFYAAAKAAAARLHAPFNWKLEFVDGVGHDEGKMGAAGVSYLGEGFGVPK